MDISQVLTIGGSFAGAILGVWLGRYLKRHNETVKWCRDRLLDAYSEFLRAMDSAVGAGNAAFRIECGTTEYDEQKRIALDKVADMQRVSDRILLLASAATEAPFQALINLVSSEIVPTLVRCPKASANDRKELQQKYGKAKSAFGTSARADLGLQERAGKPPGPI